MPIFKGDVFSLCVPQNYLYEIVSKVENKFNFKRTFVGYVMKLRVYLKHAASDGPMTNKLEWIPKENLVAYQRHYPSIYLKRLRKTNKTNILVKIGVGIA
jgi:hypothetical protein